MLSKLSFLATLREAKGSDGAEWKVCLISSGRSLNNFVYPVKTLESAIPLFEGVKAYIDHPDTGGHAYSRSVKDIGGWFEGAELLGDDLTSTFYVSEGQPWLKRMMKDAWDRGKLDLLGFSIMASGNAHSQQDGTFIVEKINRVASVDIVAVPAAGGRILSLAESKEEGEMSLEDLTIAELRKARPDLCTTIEAEVENKYPKPKKDEVCEKCKLPKAECECDAKKKADEYGKKLAADVEDGVKKLLAGFEARSTRRELLKAAVAAADLPDAAKVRLTESLQNTDFTADELTKAIAGEKAYLSDAMPKPTVTSRVKITSEVGDNWRKAMDGMLAGVPTDGVKPFRSLREAYAIISSTPYLDINPGRMLGEAMGFDSALQEEVVQVSSWAQILGDSITRRMVREYTEMPLDDWRRIVSDITPVSDFRTQRRARLGGYGALPAVSEGGTYQEFTAPTDEEATYAVTKRGGLQPLTIETIRNDDLGAVRKIPIRLARAAKVTLYQYVLNLISDNTVAIYDATVLYTSGHANLGSTALNDATLTTAKQAMRQQLAYGSSIDYLDIMPKLLLVPVQLESIAAHLRNDEFAYRQSFTADSTVLSSREANTHRGSFEIIVVPYWTDTNNWFLVADKALMPTIEMGFLDGKQEPELFTQEQPTVGSVFTADKITYKIRHIYAGAILDYRGFYGAIV